MPGSVWRPLLSGVITFVLISVVDGFIGGRGDPSVEGAYLRIIVAAIVFIILLVVARKSADERRKEILFGVAGALALYALAHVYYTPIYTAMRQFSQR